MVEAVKLVFCSGTWDNKGALAGAVSIEKSLMVSFFRGRFWKKINKMLNFSLISQHIMDDYFLYRSVVMDLDAIKRW